MRATSGKILRTRLQEINFSSMNIVETIISRDEVQKCRYT
jgi:hypothetical protein